ncbi:MAG: hypothetical protein Fur005_45370 [Roseiflexaceae bacterium]
MGAYQVAMGKILAAWAGVVDTFDPQAGGIALFDPINDGCGFRSGCSASGVEEDQ